jgi:hypothetical protein
MLASFDQDEMSLFQLEEKPETKTKVQLKENEETRKKCLSEDWNETELDLSRRKDGSAKLSWMTGRKGSQREERWQT